MNRYRKDGLPGKIITMREQRFSLRKFGAAVIATICFGGLVGLSGCTQSDTSFTLERAEVASTTRQTPADGSVESVAATATGPGPVEANATVTHISDGDTVTVTFAGGAESKVRLIGIDTPETKRPNTPIQCFGPEATRFTTSLLPIGTAIRIERDVEPTDRYGRLLAYIYRASDGLFINQTLAEYGYANLLTYPPNVAHVDEFRDAVDRARQRDRGLWRACPTTVSP